MYSIQILLSMRGLFNEHNDCAWNFRWSVVSFKENKYQMTCLIIPYDTVHCTNFDCSYVYQHRLRWILRISFPEVKLKILAQNDSPVFIKYGKLLENYFLLFEKRTRHTFVDYNKTFNWSKFELTRNYIAFIEMATLLIKIYFHHYLLEIRIGVVAAWLRQLWTYCNIDTIFMSIILVHSTNQWHIYWSIIGKLFL